MIEFCKYWVVVALPCYKYSIRRWQRHYLPELLDPSMLALSLLLLFSSYRSMDHSLLCEIILGEYFPSFDEFCFEYFLSYEVLSCSLFWFRVWEIMSKVLLFSIRSHFGLLGNFCSWEESILRYLALTSFGERSGFDFVLLKFVYFFLILAILLVRLSYRLLPKLSFELSRSLFAILMRI